MENNNNNSTNNNNDKNENSSTNDNSNVDKTSDLRKKIIAINSDPKLSAREKSKMIQVWSKEI